MQPVEQQFDRLESWKQIAAYLGKSERTVRRWQVTEGLPVHRHMHQQRGSVWAYESELNAWMNLRKQSPEPLVDEDEEATPPRRQFPRYWQTAVLALIVAGAGWWWWRSQSPDGVIERWEPQPLAAVSGAAYSLAFSPDRRQVVFFWSPENSEAKGLFVKMVGQESVRPLVTVLGRDRKFFYSPAWSPDGQTIAFLERVPGNPVETWLSLVAASGGSPRRLLRLSDHVYYWANNTHLSWGPDGSWLAVPLAEQNRRGIHRLDLATGALRQLTKPESYDEAPALSADGRSLVYLRRAGVAVAALDDMWLQALDANGHASGSPKLVYRGQGMISGFGWLPSGRELVLCASEAGNRGPFESLLFRLSTDGARTPLGVSGCSSVAVSTTDGAGRLMLGYGSAARSTASLWASSLDDGGTAARLAPSSMHDSLPSFSPDGKEVAFLSNRSGKTEVWIASSGGGEPRRLTDNALVVGGPQWSPDGTQVAFTAALRSGPEAYGIFLTPVTGGIPKRVPLKHTAIDPAWGPDGKTIYYRANKELWRVRTDGSDCVRISTRDWTGFPQPALPDPSGRYIYQARGSNREAALWRVEVTGGKEQMVVSAMSSEFFAITPKQIYFFGDDNRALKAVPLAGGQVREVMRPPDLDNRRFLLGLAVSRDESRAVWAVTANQALDLQMITDFR